METKLFYLIRWIRSGKPVYQLGELVPAPVRGHIPMPPQAFDLPGAAFQFLKRQHAKAEITLLAMGFPERERHLLNDEAARHPHIAHVKHLGHPLGRRADGKPTRIYVIDKDAEALRRIQEILLPEHFEIVGLTKSAVQGLAFVIATPAAVDVVILDLEMPDADCYAVLKQLRARQPEMAVVVTAGTDMDVDAPRLAALLVSGYIVKPIVKEQLLESLRRVLAGG